MSLGFEKKSQENPTLLFSSAEIEVFFYQGDSDFLLITFGNSNFRSNGTSFWGQAVVEKTKVTTIGFVAKRPNWYPQSDMQKALLAIAPILDKYKNIVTYGASMGAYAAIKYSSMLRCNVSLAFSPQYSIDPTFVGKFDRRFTKFFDKGRDSKCTINADDIAGKICIFFDPFFSVDRLNVDLIENEKSSNIAKIKCYMTGHDTIRMFNSTEKFKSLITYALNKSISDVVDLALSYRKSSPVRIYHLTSLAIDRHPSIATALYKKYSELFNSDEIFNLNFNFAGLSIKSSQLDVAEEQIKIALRQRPSDPGSLRRLSDILYRQGRHKDALEKCRAALALVPDYAYGYSRLAEISLALNDIENAVYAASKAARLAPNDKKLIALLDRASALLF